MPVCPQKESQRMVKICLLKLFKEQKALFYYYHLVIALR